MSTITISAITMTSGGKDHEHIDSLYSTLLGWKKRADIVTFVDNSLNTAYVSNGDTHIKVKSVHPSGRLPYVHTLRDGTPTDNLLYLPGGPHYEAK